MSSVGRPYRTWRWAPWLAALTVVSGAACAQILGLEEWNGSSASGAGGAAGTGGVPVSSSSASSSSVGSSASSSSASSSSAMSSSATSSSATSSSASGADGGCCGIPPPCMIYLCMPGCPLQKAPGGTPCGMSKTCDWDGNCDPCVGMNPCMNGCIDQGESDFGCGGPFCPICAKGQHCNGNQDCGAPITCQNGFCTP